MNKLYLASQSPRRAQILKDLGVEFEVLLPDAHEDSESLEIPLPDEPGLDYVTRVTKAKLFAAIQRVAKRPNWQWLPILCADTTVCINPDALPRLSKELILGKPRDDEHALEMLSMLNGTWHWVHTAIAMQKDQHSPIALNVSSTKVYFAQHSMQRLKSYVGTNEPRGKAGGYGIQGLGSALIERIEGSYSGVMGLPIFETTQLLDYAEIPFILSI